MGLTAANTLAQAKHQLALSIEKQRTSLQALLPVATSPSLFLPPMTRRPAVGFVCVVSEDHEWLTALVPVR